MGGQCRQDSDNYQHQSHALKSHLNPQWSMSDLDLNRGGALDGQHCHLLPSEWIGFSHLQKWVQEPPGTGTMTPNSGVITVLTIGRGPLCSINLLFAFVLLFMILSQASLYPLLVVLGCTQDVYLWLNTKLIISAFVNNLLAWGRSDVDQPFLIC